MSSQQQNQTREPKLQNGGGPISPQAFPLLHDEYRDRLLNSMTAVTRNREIAEDITAEAFTAAFENLAGFRGESSFYTWLYKIGLNLAGDWRRRNKGISLESIDRPDAKELGEPDVLVETLEHGERCLQLRQALRHIPTVYRRTLMDHFVRGYSVKRIASQDRVPVGTVLSRMFTAKRLLREAWG
jgi:RNA polymerase sigma-70 factor (ECF subfamily)